MVQHGYVHRYVGRYVLYSVHSFDCVLACAVVCVHCSISTYISVDIYISASTISDVCSYDGPVCMVTTQMWNYDSSILVRYTRHNLLTINYKKNMHHIIAGLAGDQIYMPKLQSANHSCLCPWVFIIRKTHCLILGTRVSVRFSLFSFLCFCYGTSMWCEYFVCQAEDRRNINWKAFGRFFCPKMCHTS